MKVYVTLPLAKVIYSKEVINVNMNNSTYPFGVLCIISEMKNVNKIIQSFN